MPKEPIVTDYVDLVTLVRDLAEHAKVRVVIAPKGDAITQAGADRLVALARSLSDDAKVVIKLKAR